MPGATRTAIGITGNQGAVDPTRFENLPGVAEAIRVSKPYKLISLDLRPEKTVVRVGDATIGGSEVVGVVCPGEEVEWVYGVRGNNGLIAPADGGCCWHRKRAPE